ncbi:hypothetical protein ILYODFUR_008285 [Ilyodon furcidens]|uniref:Uncharacterized protein n=1 Tax=Ilyodon furcidens TaxID=33524 RepID=A0ABV0SWN3_9TELE
MPSQGEERYGGKVVSCFKGWDLVQVLQTCRGASMTNGSPAYVIGTTSGTKNAAQLFPSESPRYNGRPGTAITATINTHFQSLRGARLTVEV